MKKFISLLLCLVMTFGLCMPAFAAEEADVTYDGYPLVIVRGIDFMGLYEEDGTPAVNLTLMDLFTFGMKFIKDYFILKNEKALIDNSLVFVDDLFSKIALDKAGNSIYELYYDKYEKSMAEYKTEMLYFDKSGEEGIVRTAVEKIGYENVFFFTYDWRKSAKELAADLNALIETALASTGKDKVNLIAVSMGGMVTTSYLYNYTGDNINNLIYLSSAHNGTYTCGDCLNGKIYVDSDTLYNQVKNILGNNFFVNLFVSLFHGVGLFDAAADIANKIIGNNSEILNSDLMRNGFGTLIGLWGLCPDDRFESGMEFLFGGHEDEYPVLMTKLEETKEFIFATEETISATIANGTDVYFVSNYNSPMGPYFENSDHQSDGVIETRFTSNFATVAPYGKTLGEDYLASADAEFVSPDGIIDASTALYKDVTWFVKDAPHVAAIYGSEFSEFVFKVVLSDEKLTVNSFEEYPRFMALDKDKKLIAQ